MLGFAALAVLLALLRPTGSAMFWYCVVIAACFVALFFLSANFGSTWNSAGVRVRGWKTVTVPWTQIDDVAEFTHYGRRGVSLRLADGSRRRLPAPVSSIRGTRDTAYAEKLAAIRALWTEHNAAERVSTTDATS
jgi:hypothetical protein